MLIDGRDTVNRRATSRLYPTPAQAAALQTQREAHRLLDNAALAQRQLAWQGQRVGLGSAQHCRDLTEVRREEAPPLPARAFEAFFRRLKAGVEPPGSPRFKSRKRLKGWSSPTHGDGWRLLPRDGRQHGRLRLSGIGPVRRRGDARTAGAPKTCAMVSRHGKWYASIVLACQPERPHGVDTRAFDWGVETFATIASTASEPVLVAHPRFLAQSAAKWKAADQSRERKKRFASGWRLANKRVAQRHSKIARQRLDCHHKHAAEMVDGAAAVCTAQLRPTKRVRRPKPKHDSTTGESLPNRAAAQAGLNTAMLASAPAPFLGLLQYKAAEAGVVYAAAPTRALKPSQRCHACDAVVKKPLRERWPTCPCGASCGRDVHSAWGVLAWGLEHVLSIFFAALWLHNGSQELTAGLGTQNLSLEP